MPYTDGQDMFARFKLGAGGSKHKTEQALRERVERRAQAWIEQVRREMMVKEIMLLLDKLDGTHLGRERVMREIQRVLDESS